MPRPIITVAQMRAWETATWATGQTEEAVIAQVGRCVATRLLALSRPGDRILILAGKGHNGDDARAASPHLAGREPEVLEVRDPAGAQAELARALARRPAWVVDGLFGIGLNRPLDSAWCALLEQVNAAGCRVLAVDVPSGLDADTGQAQGAAIRAFLTLTLGAPKVGLLKPSAAAFTGRLEVAADIGLTACPHAAELNWSLPEDFAQFPPDRPVASHKGSFGHLAIVAGSPGFHGAAVLAARGAQRAHPGLITVLTTEATYHPIAAQLQAVMVRPWTTDLKLPGDHTAFLFGPGLAAPDVPGDMKLQLRRLWRDAPVPVVVDASALDWLLFDPVPRDALRVITPHPGEAARLLNATAPQIQADRPGTVRELSRRFGCCWVVLKGYQTLVGRNTGPLFVNGSGNPHLAQGGSGDVFAGYLAGLAAQPALQSNPEKTLRYAVWQHGATADWLQERQPNWVVEDLVAHLGNQHPDGQPA